MGGLCILVATRQLIRLRPARAQTLLLLPKLGHLNAITTAGDGVMSGTGK